MEKLTMFNLIKSLIGDFKPNEKRTEMNDSEFRMTHLYFRHKNHPTFRTIMKLSGLTDDDFIKVMETRSLSPDSDMIDKVEKEVFGEVVS
jgi:hypothetical protein